MRLPHVEFVISTTTPTGLAVAEAKFPGDRVCYFPLDFSWAVRRSRAGGCGRPPSFWSSSSCGRTSCFTRIARGIPLALINGRRQPTQLPRLRAASRPLMARLLRSFEALAVAKSRLYADRLAASRAPRGSGCRVTGSIKFDRVDDRPRQSADGRAAGRLRHWSNPRRSSSPAARRSREEAAALDAYARPADPVSGSAADPRPAAQGAIRRRGPADRIARAAARFAAAPLPSATLRQHRVARAPCCCWTRWASWPRVGAWPTSPLSAAASRNRGGQNMIEPAGYGAAVLFGPNTQNFRDVVEMLLADGRGSRRAQWRRADGGCRRLPGPSRARPAQGAAPNSSSFAQQGATQRTIDILANLPGVSTFFAGTTPRRRPLSRAGSNVAMCRAL